MREDILASFNCFTRENEYTIYWIENDSYTIQLWQTYETYSVVLKFDFGNDFCSQELWNEWGSYLERTFIEYEGEYERIDDLFNDLKEINMKYNPFIKKKHWVDLDRVIQLLSSDIKKADHHQAGFHI